MKVNDREGEKLVREGEERAEDREGEGLDKKRSKTERQTKDFI